MEQINATIPAGRVCGILDGWAIGVPGVAVDAVAAELTGGFGGDGAVLASGAATGGGHGRGVGAVRVTARPQLPQRPLPVSPTVTTWRQPGKVTVSPITAQQYPHPTREVKRDRLVADPVRPSGSANSLGIASGSRNGRFRLPQAIGRQPSRLRHTDAAR